MASRIWDDPARTFDWATARAGTEFPPEMQAYFDLIHGQPGNLARYLRPEAMPPGYGPPLPYIKVTKAIDFMIARIPIVPGDAHFEGVPADFVMPLDDVLERWLLPSYPLRPGQTPTQLTPPPMTPDVAALMTSLQELQATVTSQASSMAEMREMLDTAGTSTPLTTPDPLHDEALALMPVSWQARAPLSRADAAKLVRGHGNAEFTDFAPRFVFPADMLVNSKANTKSISVKDLVHTHFHTVQKANTDAIKVNLKVLSNMLELRDDLQEISARPDHDGTVPVADVTAAFLPILESIETATNLSSNVSDTMVRISLDLFADAENFQFLKHKTVDRVESILPENTIDLMRAQKEKSDTIFQARKTFTPARKNIFGGPPRSASSAGGSTSRGRRPYTQGQRRPAYSGSNSGNWTPRPSSDYYNYDRRSGGSDHRGSSSADRSSRPRSKGGKGKGKGGGKGNRSGSRDRGDDAERPD